jgi:carbamoyltransferase
MISWGISANSHDAALAVFSDRKLVFASHSERFSRKKNDPDLCAGLVDYARYRWGNPDEVYWYENPWKKTARQMIAGQGFLWSENNVVSYLKTYNITAPTKIGNHHLSHAAGGYFTSPFDQACVISIDSIGEFETLTIWMAEGKKLKKIYSQIYPHSIGLWYSAMTQRCGLKPNEEEYILMGMSALGDPQRLYKDIKNDFISYSWPRLITIKENLHRGCLEWRPDLFTEQDRYDIAAATQQIYQEIFQSILMYARHLSQSSNLVLMGGCALNCSANPLAYGFFDDVWIMPNPGDAGSAIGSVLAKYPDWRIEHFTPYLGFDLGYRSTNEEIVAYLEKNQVCGLARGPAEFGPRALGNRSLIADPRGHDIKERVNDIKHREQFRPFAPAVLAELASDYFDIPSGRSSDYMQMVYRCKYPDLFPAVVHVDSTSRIQTVPKDGSPFRKLLEQWYQRTGCPMLLNTSLNIKGEPMVNDRKDIRKWSKTYGLPIFN